MDEAEEALWRSAVKRMTLWTVRRHGLHPEAAEDVVRDATCQLLGSDGEVPSELGELLAALGSRVNGIMVNRRRKGAELAVVLTTDGSPPEGIENESPESRLLGTEAARLAVSKLLERVEGDQLVTNVVLQYLEGVEDAATQAVNLGISVEAIYNARRRLKGHVQAVTMDEGTNE